MATTAPELVPEASGLAAPSETRSSLPARLGTWLTLAYTQYGSLAARQLADGTTLLVLVSLLAMIVEALPQRQGRFDQLFFAVEAIVALLFTADYVANIYFQKNRLRYVLGPWGLIDLLAILPFFITPIRTAGVPSLARLSLLFRTLRVLRVLKLAKIAEQSAEEHEIGLTYEEPNSWRMLLFGLVGACAAVAIGGAAGVTGDDQLYWLTISCGFAVTLAARHWFVHHDLSPLSVAFVLGTMSAGVAIAVYVDRAGDTGRAFATVWLTLAAIIVSCIMLEGREGAL